jgi:hypothetical protein
MSAKRFFQNNNLTVVIFAIFLFSILGMSVAGWLSNNKSLSEHHQTELSYGSYLITGEFAEGVFENWESEFLQMWALIMLTIYLRQKGSADSKPMRGSTFQDTTSRYSIIKAHSWRSKSKAAGHFLYSHSLGLAMLLLFIVSFSLHAIGGLNAYNQDALEHGSEMVSFFSFITSSEFWYQSLQNWQSEFLAIGALLVLSIKLRERGSPESKPVGKKYDHETGE